MVKDKAPHPIDIIVGQNLRRQRIACGMSQAELGQRLSFPIAFQQIQKYEKGLNRVAASKVAEFSIILGCEISDLFEGMEAYTNDTVEAAKGLPQLHDNKLNNLCRHYYQMPPDIQDVFRVLAGSIVKIIKSQKNEVLEDRIVFMQMALSKIANSDRVHEHYREVAKQALEDRG